MQCVAPGVVEAERPAVVAYRESVVREARARLAELEQQDVAKPAPMTAQALDTPQQIGLFAPPSAA